LSSIDPGAPFAGGGVIVDTGGASDAAAGMAGDPGGGGSGVSGGPGSGVVRGMLELNDVLFVVRGNKLQQIDSTGAVIASLGPVDDDGLLVTMSAKPDRLIFVAANKLYVVFEGALLTPATPFTPASVGVIDGLVVALAANAREFYFSPNGIDWSALDVQTAEAATNNLMNMIVDHEEVWFFGNRITQVFSLGPDPDAPLEKIRSGVITQGLAAKFALCALDNSLYWLGRNKDGDWIVWRANGYTPTRISTHAIENEIRKYPRKDDAIMWTYQLNGHSCFRLTFPSANDGFGATWEYDVTTNTWTATEFWNLQTGRYERHRGNVATAAFGKVLVGDYANGLIYEMSPDFFHDFGYPIRWERRTPHLTAERKRVKYQRFHLFTEVGVGLTTPLWLHHHNISTADFIEALDAAVLAGTVTEEQSTILQKIFQYQPYVPLDPYPARDVMEALGFFAWGEDPVLQMRYSNNGAQNFNSYSVRRMGRAGDYDRRIFWNGCGSGYDRVWEVSGSDPVRLAIVQATFDGEVCLN